MDVNISEVMRYLGYQGQEGAEGIKALAQDCVNELQASVQMRSLWHRFPVEIQNGVVWMGPMRIESRDLRGHLHACGQALLFAATLGPQADLLLERTSKMDMGRAVILQAAAAALIEAYCDHCERVIEEEMNPQGLFLRPRYSPGYGDFPIALQLDLLKALDAPKKIGLTATDSFMLAPTKSVTAVIGLTREKQSCHIGKCMGCDASQCPFRRDGNG